MSIKADIQLADIEKQLNILWEQQREKNQIKACLFNLILYAPDRSRNDYLREISRIIAQRFPCRIIFILGDNKPNKNYLHVLVSQEMVSDGEVTIACDLINIYVSEEQLARVPYLVIPHLVPDLPVNLLWAHDPTQEQHLLPSLEPYANRLIFDAECEHGLKDFAKRIQQQCLKNYDLIDMNWIMISGWREVIQETFYTEERILDLNQSVVITLTFHLEKDEDFHKSDIQAIYLQGWLAAQMGWKFLRKEMKENTLSIFFHADANEVEIKIVGQKGKEGLLAGAITTVEITTAIVHSYFLQRQGIEAQVLVHISSAEQCELPFTLPLPVLRRGTAFLKELFFHPIGEQYAKMLQLISSIDWE